MTVPAPVGVVEREVLDDREVRDADGPESGHERVDRGPGVLGRARGRNGREQGQRGNEDDGAGHVHGYNGSAP